MGFDTLDAGLRTGILLGLAVLIGYALGVSRPWALRDQPPGDDGDYVSELRGGRDLARVRLMRLQQRCERRMTPLSFYDAASCRTGLDARRRAWGPK